MNFLAFFILATSLLLFIKADVNVRFDFSFTCSLKDTYDVEVRTCEDDMTSKKCSEFTKVFCYGRVQACLVSTELSDSSSEFGGSYEFYVDITHTCSSGYPRLHDHYPSANIGKFIDVPKAGPSNVVLPVTLNLDNYHW